MPIQAGSLRHRVDLQSSTAAANVYGEEVETWVTDSVIFASVAPLIGKELTDAQSVVANTSHKVFVRYKSAKNISTQQRFLIPRQVGSLGASIDDDGATVSITVSDADDISDLGDFIIRIDSENMIVTAGQGTTTWTVTRGAFGTTGATHANGATVTKLVALEIKTIANIKEKNEFLRLDCMESTSQIG